MSVIYKDTELTISNTIPTINDAAPVIKKSKSLESSGYTFMKRMLDIVCSSTALIILLPLLTIACIAIVLYDFGSPFYLQYRVGKDGKRFKIFKLRTMRKNAHQLREVLKECNESEGANFKLKKDPRITKPGEFLRKTSIDELPQLVNIIKGDMSIIGPRPFIPEEQAELPEDRLVVKPGLSCYWQISGKNNLSKEQQIELDRKYIRECSFSTDVKITFKTCMMVLKGCNW